MQSLLGRVSGSHSFLLASNQTHATTRHFAILVMAVLCLGFTLPAQAYFYAEGTPGLYGTTNVGHYIEMRSIGTQNTRFSTNGQVWMRASTGNEPVEYAHVNAIAYGYDEPWEDGEGSTPMWSQAFVTAVYQYRFGFTQTQLPDWIPRLNGRDYIANPLTRDEYDAWLSSLSGTGKYFYWANYTIPFQVDYMLSIGGTGYDTQNAFARVSISGANPTEEGGLTYSSLDETHFNGRKDRTGRFLLTASLESILMGETLVMLETYGQLVATGSGNSNSVYAYADPIITVDPTWEFASDFSVGFAYAPTGSSQFSDLQSVSLPASLMLFGAGLLGLGWRRYVAKTADGYLRSE